MLQPYSLPCSCPFTLCRLRAGRRTSNAQTRAVVGHKLNCRVDLEVEAVRIGNFLGIATVAEILLGHNQREILRVDEIDCPRVPCILTEHVTCSLECQNLEPSLEFVRIDVALIRLLRTLEQRLSRRIRNHQR